METGPPGEEELLANFFKFLRQEHKLASSSLWMSMMKRKYDVQLQELPRLTMLIKSFDTNIKDTARIFEEAQIKMLTYDGKHGVDVLAGQAGHLNCHLFWAACASRNAARTWS